MANKIKGNIQTAQFVKIPTWWYGRVKKLAEDEGFGSTRAYFIHIFHGLLMEHDEDYIKEYSKKGMKNGQK